MNLVTLIGATVAALVVGRLGHSLAGQTAALFMGLGAFVALVGWFQMRLEEREQLERLEFDELNRTKGSAGLFQGQDAGGFAARRAREQFQKWVVPVFTVLLAVVEGVLGFVNWRLLDKPEATGALAQPAVTLSLFGLIFLVLFLVGRFTSAIGRLEDGRWLRPGSSFTLISAYASAAVAVGVAGVLLEVPRLDWIVAKVLAALLMLVALETVVNLVFEVYRPRVRGAALRPLYESRLLGLLAHPEDVFSTAAHALDYQFGFKVSETWFYQYFRRALAWILLLQFAVLLGSTCVVFIEPGERGLLERCGRLVEERGELEPGAHWKWPWPVDSVRRFQTEQVQTFIIGSQPETNAISARAVLWTKQHAKEELLLVGSKESVAADGKAVEAMGQTPPVSLIAVSFPVQFQISDLMAWAYGCEDPARLLEGIATRAVVKHLAGSDFFAVMASERLEAAERLRAEIQAEADRVNLGVKINYIGLQDIHPPVSVAGEFENVLAAGQQREAAILRARAAASSTDALSDATAFQAVALAEAYRTREQLNIQARTALFTNQIPAYRAAPSIYRNRAYFRTLAEATREARKYVLLTTNNQEVLQFDLQEKLGSDFSNIRLKDVGN